MKFNKYTSNPKSKFKKEYPKVGGKEVIVEYDNVDQALRKFKKKLSSQIQL